LKASQIELSEWRMRARISGVSAELTALRQSVLVAARHPFSAKGAEIAECA
jgi:hypothetical protein